MIIGAHPIIDRADAEADRAFLRDVIVLSHVEVGGGRLGLDQPCHARPQAMDA